MTSDASQMVEDLSKHAARELQTVMNRHFAVAQDVLSPAECGMLMLNVANGFVLGTALFAMQVARDEVTPDQIWDLIAEALPKMFELGRPQVIAAFADRGRAA